MHPFVVTSRHMSNHVVIRGQVSKVFKDQGESRTKFSSGFSSTSMSIRVSNFTGNNNILVKAEGQSIKNDN